jgi:hypothetical protein
VATGFELGQLLYYVIMSQFVGLVPFYKNKNKIAEESAEIFFFKYS